MNKGQKNKNYPWVGHFYEPLVGFKWRPSDFSRNAAEIVVWNDVFLHDDSENSYAILLMDTQGVYNSGLSITSVANILALNALFSTFFIYNVEFPMSTDNFESLRLSLEHGKNLLDAKVNHEGEDFAAQPFHSFAFLFHDVNRKVDQRWGFNGGSEFVRKYFAAKDFDFNVNAAFENIFGFSMPPSGNAMLHKTYDGRFAYLDPEFQVHLQTFISEIFSPHNFKAKAILGREIDVFDYLKGIKVLCTAVKANEIKPEKLTFKFDLDRQLNELINGYKYEMRNIDQALVEVFLETVSKERTRMLNLLLKLYVNNEELSENNALGDYNRLLSQEVVDEFVNWSNNLHIIFLNSAGIHADFNALINLAGDISEKISQITVNHRPPVNLNFCENTEDVFADDGTFLKSFCNVQRFLNYLDAEKFCFDNGMDLAMVENEAIYYDLNEFVTKIYPDKKKVWDHGAGLWINGRFDGTEWFGYRNFQKEPLRGVLRVVEEQKHGGFCAVLKRNYSVELRNYDCMKRYHFMCEYNSIL